MTGVTDSAPEIGSGAYCLRWNAVGSGINITWILLNWLDSVAVFVLVPEF